MALFEKKDEKKTAVSPKMKESLPLQTLANNVLLSTRVTEKSYLLNELNQYVFRVSKEATKASVKLAIETVYGVRPEKVHIVNVPRKRKLSGRNEIFTSGMKKAIVTVAKGETLTQTTGA